MKKLQMEVVCLLLDTDGKAAAVPSKQLGLLLHWACETMQPVEMITKLCLGAPEVAQKTDKGGNLPLHICCEKGDSMPVAIIRAVLGTFPAATRHKDKDGEYADGRARILGCLLLAC